MAKRLLSTELPTNGRWVPLAKGEAHHALNVLRLRDGDTVTALDGKGHLVTALLKVRSGEAFLVEKEAGERVSESQDSETQPICLEIAALKGHAMEWAIEKAVELGVRDMVPLLTDYTIVQVRTKGAETFQKRWQLLADQSLKQCGRLHQMKVHLPIAVKDHLSAKKSDARFWCDEQRSSSTRDLSSIFADQTIDQKLSKPIHLLIGPEGGWSPNEREFLLREQCIPVSLGPLILRAETAALFATSIAAGYLRSQKI